MKIKLYILNKKKDRCNLTACLIFFKISNTLDINESNKMHKYNENKINR